jgi:hypothetical protein
MMTERPSGGLQMKFGIEDLLQSPRAGHRVALLVVGV